MRMGQGVMTGLGHGGITCVLQTQFSSFFFFLNFFAGTDATHAEHIETIKSRNYVGVRHDGRLVPGQLGMGLVEGKITQFRMSD